MLLERVLNVLVLGSWLVLLGYLIRFIILTTMREGPGTMLARLLRARMLYLILLATVVISALNSSAVFIEPQEVGVVVSLLSANGYRPRPLRSGLHWIVPLAEEVHRYPIAWQTYTMSAKPNEGAQAGDDSIAARTSDGQEVIIDCTIIYQINPEEAPRIFIEWQERYLADLIRPTLRSLIRTYVSQYKVDEVNSSKRLDLENDLSRQLKTSLNDKGFNLDTFLLRNITFSTEYAQAVEQKQVALQDAVKKQYEAEQIQKLAEGEAARVRLMAQAEADALNLLGQALRQNPDVVTLRYVDKLAPNIQVMLVPNNTPYLLPLPSLNATAAASSALTTTTPASMVDSILATPSATTPPATPAP